MKVRAGQVWRLVIHLANMRRIDALYLVFAIEEAPADFSWGVSRLCARIVDLDNGDAGWQPVDTMVSPTWELFAEPELA